ncbi:agmatine deiminase family protein [Streptomyces sp. UNOC14_S4]|uniref:agmatine deiminase family protein n=1 Tax=Streptomyces sp. UNOC14_S4 TaxID=2872340 RepID=UPI0035B0C161
MATTPGRPYPPREVRRPACRGSAGRRRRLLRDGRRGHPAGHRELGGQQEPQHRITGRGDAFVSTYANFYVANGAVFMPRFGDAKADDHAKGILQDRFPRRDIVQVKIDTIASGGGIHCATHDQPGKPGKPGKPGA